MKNYIELFINGHLHSVSGDDAFLPLSDFLRTKLCLPGTKEVCIEGDCGACTTLIGKLENGKINYQTIDSCISYVYQLDKCHIVTVEGIKNSKLNSVQEAMIKCHGAQCGFCTPGFVVSLYSFFNASDSKKCTRSNVQNTLIGNLCRCTGYETIIEAALSVENNSVEKPYEIYPDEKLKPSLEKKNNENIEIRASDRIFYQPHSLKEALRLKNENPDSRILAGGTDLHVMCNKRDLEPEKIIYISSLKELQSLEVKNDFITIGAAVTLTEFETKASKYYPGLKEYMELFASPQIKNIGTLVGNIANGSPIGDTLPFLFVMDAKLTVESIKGKRQININNLYKGYRALAVEPSEIITQIDIPLLQKNEILRFYKASKRKHLDISSFSAAIKLKETNNTIDKAQIAFGGVGPTIQRMHKIEEYLIGKKISEKAFEEASNLVNSEIKPISDVRGDKEYRLQLAKNILKKFYFELEQGKVFA